MSYRHTIRGFVVLVAVLFVCTSSRYTLRAAPWPLNCANVCGRSTQCDATCFATQQDFDLDNPTTCVEAAGSDSDCHFEDWDTCNYLCSPAGSSSTGCLINGVAATCWDFNLFSQCGDGACAGEEDPSWCPDDCYADAEYDSGQEGTIQDLVNDIDTAGGFDGTATGAGITASVYHDYNFVDDPGEVDTSEPSILFCSAKMNRIAAGQKALNAAKNLQRRMSIFNPFMFGALEFAIYLNGQAIANLETLLANLQGQSCYDVVFVWIY